MKVIITGDALSFASLKKALSYKLDTQAYMESYVLVA